MEMLTGRWVAIWCDLSVVANPGMTKVSLGWTTNMSRVVAQPVVKQVGLWGASNVT